MIKFGIFTTAAEVWFHLHPLVPAIYYYRVTDCRAFIQEHDPIHLFGKSKNGAISATGFLIPKNATFVKRRMLSSTRVGTPKSWQCLTDRETGLRGVQLTVALLRLGVFPELGTKVRVTETQDDQYAGLDLFVGKTAAEIKTERVISVNLFVQDEEGGHCPTVLADGTERASDLPPFTPTMQLQLMETDAERAGHSNGFVGYAADGTFVHYCHCGASAGSGINVSRRNGNLGTWFCSKHMKSREKSEQ